MSSSGGIQIPVEGQKVSYAEMRMVAQEIHRLEKQARRIRTIALVSSGLFLGTAVFAGVIFLLVKAFAETEVKREDGTATLVKKDTTDVVQTTQSLEDRDGSSLLDYARNTLDANGDPDGDWKLTDEQISRIRTISWKAGQVMEVHHVAEIVRYDGTDTRVEITTKANHKITIWNNDCLGQNNVPISGCTADKFDVMIRRYDRTTNTYAAEEEVNANGDEGTEGKGRVVVSLERPKVEAKETINLDDYLDDD